MAKLEQANKLDPWQRFLGLLRIDARDVRHIVFYAFFAGLVALTLPLGIQAIINLIQGGQVSTSWIILVVLVTLGVAFQGLLQFMQIRIIEQIQRKIFMRSAVEFSYRFPKIKMKELTNFYPPELANRFFDTLTVQKSLPKILLEFPAAILQTIFGLTLLSFYHPFFIIYGLLLVLLVYVLFRFTAKRGLETSLIESKYKYKTAHWIQEVARSLISFKNSGNTRWAMQKTDALTDSYLEARENHFKILMIQFGQIIGFKILVTVGLLLIGGLLVINQQMNIGQFVAAEIVILLVIASVEKLITNLEVIYDMLTSLEKIGQVVDLDLEKQSGVDPFTGGKKMHLELLDVSYENEEGKELFSDLSLEVNSGDRVLLQGPPGSGKSTFIKVIGGIFEASSGKIYINDTEVQNIYLDRFREEVGQALPEQTPFEGTLLQNITLGHEDISEDKVNEVIVNVGLKEFVRKQSKGIQTIIYPEGRQIPNTISRKIVLARAIVSDPLLLLLKDPLENIEETERNRIIDYLTAPQRPWSIIVSSRCSYWAEKANKNVDISNHRNA